MLSIIAPKLEKVRFGVFNVHYWIMPFTIRHFMTSDDPYFEERMISALIHPSGFMGWVARPFVRPALMIWINLKIIECLPDQPENAPAKGNSVAAESAIAELLPRAVISTGLPLSEILDMTYRDLIWFTRVADQVRLENHFANMAAGSLKTPELPVLTPDSRYENTAKAAKKNIDPGLFARVQGAALNAGASKEVD